MERRLVYLCVVFLFLSTWGQAEGSRYAASSVLSNGLWKKIRIEKTGIYKITYEELKKMGFSDPAAVSVHGYGGWPLDEDFTHPYVDDLPAVAVYRGGDYLLFYGKGPVKWEYEAAKKQFKHTNNPYSMYGCYFLTNATPAKAIETVPLLKEDAALKITTFDDYRLYEEEHLSVNKSGRDLFWKKFSNRTLSVSLESIPGTIEDTQLVTCRTISKTTNRQQLTLFVNDEDIHTEDVPQLYGDELRYIEYVKGKSFEFTTGWKGLGNKIKLTFTLTSATDAYLDYVRLQAQRTLKMYEEACTFFRSIASLNNTSRFVIEGADTHTLVFDITDAFNLKQMETNPVENGLSFTIPSSSILKEFAFVRPDKSLPVIKAENVEDVVNQDLHSLAAKDMIIISAVSFCDEALRLAEVHQERDDLRVGVVTPEEIYNEFSSGTPDATAYRRFMKMFYDRRKPDGSDAPRYLLLFGDGSYDNRFLTDEWKRTAEAERKNMLLTYQTEESLNMYSYAVEDYFGFLDDRENIYSGGGSYEPSSYATLDIGIGRFPVRTLQQAKNAVDKFISYMDNKNTGIWKNSLTFIADDGSNADGFSTRHQGDADGIAEQVVGSRPEYMVNKIYFDAYKKSAGTTNPYPGVRTDIQNALNRGTLLLNYTGHGGTEALSDEKVITNNDILQAKHTCLPLWITATCDFCRFDDLGTSAGENVFLNARSGGIALFTTSRVAFMDINKSVNSAFMKHLLEDKDAKSLTLGDVFKRTKADTTDGRKLGFNLIGDPALRLTYPTHQVRLTAINDQPLGDSVVEFKAFEKVNMEGNIADPEGNLASDFNGELSIRILDAKQTYKTLGNNSSDKTLTYQDYSGTIFKGTCLVMDGKFRFSFVVPKSISYSNDNCGKISFYALDKTTGKEGAGYFRKFVANGTADEYEKDTDAPEIRALYLNDSTFTDGGQVNTAPYFFARLWDKSGVNITGNSPGHEINLTIDNNPRLNYTLDNYFEDVPGSEGEGLVKFPVPKLEAGLHTAVFKVWDIMDNARLDTFTFEVVEGLRPFISELMANPSPARENVEFRFSHNRPACRMKVSIMVYDLAGRQMWRHDETGTSDLFQDYVVNWDLSKADGTRMRTGVYLYRAAISTDNSKEATEAKKMIVLSGR